MTRMRTPHDYHEPQVHRIDTLCIKCETTTPHVCEWCGACLACHKGSQEEEKY
jgi:hypothetical protein